MSDTEIEKAQRAQAQKLFCQPCEFIKGVVAIDRSEERRVGKEC